MENIAKERTITLNIGSSVSMYGVKDIRGFDEGYVSLDTASGKISVEGENLKIESLSKEDGHVFISGNVSGVFCDIEVNEKKGFMKRLFTRE